MSEKNRDSSSRRSFLRSAIKGTAEFVVGAAGTSALSVGALNAYFESQARKAFVPLNTLDTIANQRKTFFVESRAEAAASIKTGGSKSRGEWLTQKIGSDEVMQRLVQTNSGIAMALDINDVANDPAIIALLQEYTRHKIPLELWATLSEEKGYWLHAGNVPDARREIVEMVDRLAKNNIKISRIGLDLEKAGKEDATGKLSEAQYDRACILFFGFVDELLKTSCGVTTYEIPVISDYRNLRRFLRVLPAPNINSEKLGRVAMAYTTMESYLTPFRGGIRDKTFIRNACRNCKIPALGILTATGRNPGQDAEWDTFLGGAQLEKNIQTAMEISPAELYIFALNGRHVIDDVQAAVEKQKGMLSYSP